MRSRAPSLRVTTAHRFAVSRSGTSSISTSSACSFNGSITDVTTGPTLPTRICSSAGKTRCNMARSAPGSSGICGACRRASNAYVSTANSRKPRLRWRPLHLSAVIGINKTTAIRYAAKLLRP